MAATCHGRAAVCPCCRRGVRGCTASRYRRDGDGLRPAMGLLALSPGELARRLGEPTLLGRGRCRRGLATRASTCRPAPACPRRHAWPYWDASGSDSSGQRRRRRAAHSICDPLKRSFGVVQPRSVDLSAPGTSTRSWRSSVPRSHAVVARRFLYEIEQNRVARCHVVRDGGRSSATSASGRSPTRSTSRTSRFTPRTAAAACPRHCSRFLAEARARDVAWSSSRCAE